MRGGSPSTLHPDLAPSDYHLFGPLKNHLCGTKFSGESSERNLLQMIKISAKRFLRKGILKKKLVHRWENVYQYMRIMLKNKS